VRLHRKADGTHTGTIQQSFPRNSSLMGRYAVLAGKQLPTLTTAYTSNQPQSASLNLTVTLTQLTKVSTTISTVLTTTLNQSVNQSQHH
jgi:hypothetical protein